MPVVVSPDIGDPNTKKSLHVWGMTLVYDRTEKILTCVDLGGTGWNANTRNVQLIQ